MASPLRVRERALVAIQFYRVLGAVFLVLWAGGHLPGAFALPAGLGDVATGLAAPIVGYAIARWPDKQRDVAWWNAFGVADLVVAVTTGFLSSPGATQMLALDAPNRLITASGTALRSAGLVDLARPCMATARRSHFGCDRPSSGRVKDCYIGFLLPDTVRRGPLRVKDGDFGFGAERRVRLRQPTLRRLAAA
jgi:hypothetical protein